MPTSCAALYTRLAELTQRIDDELAQAGNGVAIDYRALEQRVADALGEVERGLHAQVLARLDIDVPAIRKVAAWTEGRPIRPTPFFASFVPSVISCTTSRGQRLGQRRSHLRVRS